MEEALLASLDFLFGGSRRYQAPPPSAYLASRPSYQNSLHFHLERLQYRELTPEDYELLSKLDEKDG